MTSNYQLQGQDTSLLPDDDKPILAYVPLWKCDFFLSWIQPMLSWFIFKNVLLCPRTVLGSTFHP